MNNPGSGQPNPFANPTGPARQQPYGFPPSSYPQQPRYGEEPLLNDPYGSQNSSTTRLAAASPGLYDQNGQFLLSTSALSLLISSLASQDYSQQYASSVDSHASYPSISPFADPGLGTSEPYPAWSADRQIPMSTEEIEDVFIDLSQKFGFQRDSMRNMVRYFPRYCLLQFFDLPCQQFDFLMHLLDSRASRMTPNQALLTLHADYIGGQHANYRKWYFAAQLNLDDAVGQSQNPGLQRLKSTKGQGGKSKHLDSALNRWRNAMNNMSQYDRLRQIALFLLCWGEAGNVRFVPETLCFIFKCADDYYRSPECQNRVEPVPEGLYLNTVIKPLYRFMRDQGYEVVDGKFVRKEKDHDQIIGYDDINQLFWYPEGLAKIVLNDNVCILSFYCYCTLMIFSTEPTGRSRACSTLHETWSR